MREVAEQTEKAIETQKERLKNLKFFLELTCFVLIFLPCQTIFYCAELLEKWNKLTGSYFFIKLPSKICLDAFVWLLTIKTTTFFSLFESSWIFFKSLKTSWILLEFHFANPVDTLPKESSRRGRRGGSCNAQRCHLYQKKALEE